MENSQKCLELSLLHFFVDEGAMHARHLHVASTCSKTFSVDAVQRRKYTVQQLKRGRFFALVTCDVHQCGFVAGAGLAVGSD